ncbi:hypothetical protein LHEJCM1120_02420 [Lactobacillus helveticus]|nr:hypothetical protein LHEJCM1120_02420 [Lactobacillus helveticus]
MALGVQWSVYTKKAACVSSFWNERLADLITFNDVKPAVNQIETNVWNQEWKSQTYMEKEAVQPEAWAPFAEGLTIFLPILF